MTESMLARYQRLRAKVAGHKSMIHRERQALRTAAAELEQVEAQCRRLGIALIASPSGTGALHSHADRRA